MMRSRQAPFNYTGGPAASWDETRRGLARPLPFEYEPVYLEHFQQVYGVQLSDGEHANMKPAVFRIGHMGPSATSLHPVVALAALGKGLRDFGVGVDIGAGLEAAIEVLGRDVARPAALSAA